MASAASVQNIDVRLGFAGHTYYNTIVRNSSGEVLFPDEPEMLGGVLEQADDIWGLPRLFDFAVGEVLRLTATIDDGPDGGVLSCNLGGLDCATGATLDANPTDPLSIFYGTTGWFRGGLTPGSTLDYDLLQFAVNVPTESGDLATWFVLRGEFDVLEDQPQPAPVPLPAPALLLPVGLAGLAMLRRGQKRQRV
ncbi:hypothetical protein [Paracoccus beibuensis]|uniref:hypothetical protein n=1 Tax=Paracoccus beibuensis TaxID=547602 RepID=UPI00223EF9A4|nr:hypothetical protein [Paracoccus beibuensis]